MRLITKNPENRWINRLRLAVVEQIPFEIETNEYSRHNREFKKLKIGHLIDLDVAL